MNDKQQKLAIGCLLHDFGKLLYRYNDGRNHSTSGYEYLKELDGLRDEKEILNCVQYHHKKMLLQASLPEDDLAYIAYIADNISSAVDRREKDGNDDGNGGFVREVSLESIFNIINGNEDTKVYAPKKTELSTGINYPTEKVPGYDESFYAGIVNDIKSLLGQLYFGDEYINSLLQVLETQLAFVPSSTNMGELRDISLYDHLKLTAAFALCIEHYLDEAGIKNYKAELFDDEKAFYAKKAFRLYSIDLSGIQSFIYNISSEGALKGLRARSFYLEILMETAVDEILSRLELCRANVLYTGGGHTYIITPATEKCKNEIEQFEKELKDWFIENFGAELYGAGGWADCSAEDLQNKPDGSYKEIFRTVSKNISDRKLNRYTSEEILKLNSKGKEKHARECVMCHRSDRLDGDKCSICSSLESLSGMIIGEKDSFYVISKTKIADNAVIMPFNQYFSACKKAEMMDAMKQDGYTRGYTKNTPFTGKDIASNLWVGDYASAREFTELAQKSTGIKRLGVIRADVDNLGQSFVNGFSGKYETITRTSVFSRKLSMFFKFHINGILQNGTFSLDGEKAGARNAVIVYAGGDDLFIVGAWDSVLCFAIDLYESLKKYSQGQMTISAGLGMYSPKYPIAAIARETGDLESISKNYDNGSKNAITLFGSTYHWEELIDNVIGEKLATLKGFFKEKSGSEQDEGNHHNNAMLYKILQLIRDRKKENKLNIARFAYALARMKPDKKSGENDKAYEERLATYNDFAKKMYRWIQDDKACKELETAITIYVYLHRETNKEDK